MQPTTLVGQYFPQVNNMNCNAVVRQRQHLAKETGKDVEQSPTAFSACCDAAQSLYWHHIIASLCLSPCLQDQQQPVAQSLTHLFLLWVMTGKKEGKSRVKSQGPFSAVASASPSSLAC